MERPSDCPKDAAYIKTTDQGSRIDLPGDTSFPLVFEGGDGDDHVTVIGPGGQQVLVDGGKGNDSLVVQDQWTWLASRLTPGEVSFLVVVLLVFGTIGVLGWRALGGATSRSGRKFGGS